MDKIKVQFIGIKDIPNKKDDEIFRSRKVKWENAGYITEEYLSSHDYHIILINCAFTYPYPSNLEFYDYIISGGIAVLFLCPSKSYPWGDNSANFLIVSTSIGESIEPNPKFWLKKILGKYHFFWYCLLKPGNLLEKQQNLIDLTHLLKRQLKETVESNDVFEVAGTTITGKCISAVIHYGKGKLILLPIPQIMSVDLIRELLDGIKSNYFKKDEIPEIRPPWIEKWNLQPEIKLKSEMDAIVKEYKIIKEVQERYESYKKILYIHGRELSYSVYLILKDMGFDAILKEDNGRQDIEIKCSSFFAIIEVKGLKGYANNDDLRQLLDYYVTTSESNPEVKGIFIVNHFRDNDPSERREPYSQGAITLAMKNAFCLLTTVDLFKMHNLLLDGKITINQIIDLFKTTKGFCDVENII